MVYLLNFPRPTGLEPTIYRNKPIIKPETVEIEPGYFLEDPYTNPDIESYNSIYEAIKAITEYNNNDDYLSLLKIEE